MRVNELIDILRDQPAGGRGRARRGGARRRRGRGHHRRSLRDRGVLPWVDADDDDDDDAADDAGETPDGDSGAITIWLVGGEDKDVDAFLDAIEQSVDDEHEPESRLTS